MRISDWSSDVCSSDLGPAMSNRNDPSRKISALRGTELSCKSWLTEAPYRMIQNNLDAEVAENPAELVVYGGIGRAARDWDCYAAPLASLKNLGDDDTLLVQPRLEEQPSAHQSLM